MELPIPSDEQTAIIQKTPGNIIVDSVAGSGKTTTILHIAKNNPNTRIMILTYNKRLKFETRHKVAALGLQNAETHSYHSFCVKYYDNKCFTDSEIKQIIRSDKQKLQSFAFDFLILDEAQDMTPMYFELVCKILRDSEITVKNVCLIGDRFQSIFEFNLADNRFLTYADRIFTRYSDWELKKLAVSFRLTRENADFINNCALQDQRLRAIKNGDKPTYAVCDCFDTNIYSYGPWMELSSLMKRYTNEDIFVIAPSVKSESSPIKKLANIASAHNIPIYVPNSDEEKLDEDVIKHKIAFSTFHQVKGLERKAVIVMNFDNSYFKYYQRGKDETICTNDMYVALTRAKEKLVVIHHCTNDYIPFLSKHLLQQYCVLKYYQHLSVTKQKGNSTHKIQVTELVKHLPISVIDDAMGNLEIETTKSKKKKIKIPTKVRQGTYSENVSEINGVAIPSYFEYKLLGRMTINDQLRKVDKNISLKNIDCTGLLRLANEYCSYRSGYIFKLKQITQYDWLQTAELNNAIKRLDGVISKNAVFEKCITLSGEPELCGKELTGFIDCVDVDTVYELKCTEKLEKEHMLQTALYMYLHQTEMSNIRLKLKEYALVVNGVVNNDFEKLAQGQDLKIDMPKELKGIFSHISTSGLTINMQNVDTIMDVFDKKSRELTREYRYRLFNVLTEETLEVRATLSNLKKMTQTLIHAKYSDQKKTTDDGFIKRMVGVSNKYV